MKVGGIIATSLVFLISATPLIFIIMAIISGVDIFIYSGGVWKDEKGREIKLEPTLKNMEPEQVKYLFISSLVIALFTSTVLTIFTNVLNNLLMLVGIEIM